MCTFKKEIKNFELKVDVQEGPLRFKGKLTLDVLVSSYLPYFIQRMCVVGSYYYEFYPIDDKIFNIFNNSWKVKVDYICNKNIFIS